MAAVRRSFVLWLAVVSLLWAALACAQSGMGGGLSGRLTDLYSKPLSGVTVTLRNTLTGAETRTTTAKNGAYRFAGLAPGEYTLVAASAQLGEGRLEGIEVAAGFEQHIQAAVQLAPVWATHGALVAAARPQKESPFLSVGAAPEALRAAAPRMLMLAGLPVLVAADVPAVAVSASAEPGDAELAAEMDAAAEKAHAQIANLTAAEAALRANAAVEAPAMDATPLSSASMTLTGEEVRALPVAGRNWQEFTLGSLPAGNQSNGVEGAEIGANSRRGAVSVDGAERGLAFRSRGMSRGMGETPTMPVATDSAMQMAEAAGGGETRVETRGGGAKVHAEASLFTRQNVWGAQNPFTQWVTATPPASGTGFPVITSTPYTPGDREAIWSMGVGGPLRRFRMNWFASLAGEERNNPGLATVRHPEDFFAQPSWDELAILSARLGVPTNDPQGQGLQQYSQELEQLAGLLGPAPRTSSHWAGFGRIDWAVAARHRITVEGSGAHTDSPGGGLTRAAEMYGSNSFGSRRASDEWLLARWEAFVTPNLLAVTQLSAGRQIEERAAGAPSAFEQPFLNINAWGQLPQIAVDSRDGFTIGNPAWFGAGSYPDERSYEAQEGVDWVHGRLLVKAGVDLRHNADATSMLRNGTGTYHYSRLENFISDALVFSTLGMGGELNPMDPHNCDQRGKAWRDATGLHGLGPLPCYSWYSQTMGPNEWRVSTNDLAGFATAMWQPAHSLTLSAGLRWEREQIPPPIAMVNNPDLPLTQKSPGLGNEWSPRVGLAWGVRESRWPVLQLGYGMYFGRTPNSLLESVLTQTGSPNGDLDFFLRPTDNLQGGIGGAPPFPYVMWGQPATFLKPGAAEFAPQFRNPEVHQAMVGVEERLPGHLRVSVHAMASLARRLPVTVDTNYVPLTSADMITYTVVDPTGGGPIRKPQVTVPFYTSRLTQATDEILQPDNYQQVTQVLSRANSTYEAGTVRLSRSAQRGLSFHLQYIYAHAMDWNPNESTQLLRASVQDPGDFAEEYGTSDLDMRHSGSGIVLWQAPWKLTGAAGGLLNGWSLAGTGHYRGGMPFTMRTSESIPAEFLAGGGVIPGLGPGMNGYGGASRVYGVGRNTYRYPATWKGDARLGKKLTLPHRYELELMAESFNLFNHRNVTEIETIGYTIEPGSSAAALPTLNFMTGTKTGTTEFGQPLNVNATDYYRPRQIDFGLRLRFLVEPDTLP